MNLENKCLVESIIGNLWTERNIKTDRLRTAAIGRKQPLTERLIDTKRTVGYTNKFPFVSHYFHFRVLAKRIYFLSKKLSMRTSNQKIKKVNVLSAVDNTALYNYVKVGALNDHMLNVVQVENRTLEFHTHANSDEMFYVIEGEMQLAFKNEIIDLKEGDFVVVPKGVLHRPICTSLVKILLIEKNGTLTKDNTGGTYTE